MGVTISKRGPCAHEPLSPETLAELCTETRFTEEELLKLYEKFYTDCPDGKLTFKQFHREYSKIMGKPRKKTLDYIKHMFNVYDQDKNQVIDFREFAIALSATSAVNRVRLVETIFSIFDLDNDGRITKDEIGKMLHTLVDVTDSNRKHYYDDVTDRNVNRRTHLQKSIDDAFHELNSNHDEYITKTEFVKWYIESGFLSDLQSEESDTSRQNFSQHIEEKSQTSPSKPTSADKNKKDKRLSSQTIYMSRMIERKPPLTADDDDDVEDYLYHTHINERTTTDSSGVYHLRASNQWTSVLESVWEQSHGESFRQKLHQRSTNNHHRMIHVCPVKQQYNKQESNMRSSSPDIITDWF